jgi:hypothetical protein
MLRIAVTESDPGKPFEVFLSQDKDVPPTGMDEIAKIVLARLHA